MTVTPRLKMPLLFAGQAAKEETHNEALLLCDALIAPLALAVRTAPPVEPHPGAMWVVASGATGDWAAMDQTLALWTAGGWRFVAPVSGQTCRIDETGECWRFDGASWQSPRAVPTVAGGGVVDAEARAAVAAIRLILQDAGLTTA